MWSVFLRRIGQDRKGPFCENPIFEWIRLFVPLQNKIALQSGQIPALTSMVNKTFGGSLPAFIAAFTKHQKISDAELDAIQEMINRYRAGGTP